MRLFMLKQNENGGYDTYDSCVVCAENEEEAVKIHPVTWADDYWESKANSVCAEWASKPENVTAIYLGEADKTIEKGVVLSSFNAG